MKGFNLTPSLIHEKVTDETLLSAPLCVAMEQTLQRRLKQEKYRKFINSFDCIIIDECHKSSFDKYFPYFNQKTIVMGYTATPARYGVQKSLELFYTTMVHGPSINELISLGYLSEAFTRVSPMDLKGIRKKGNDYDKNQLDDRFQKPKYSKGVVKNYNLYTPGTMALIFCPGVKSSKELCSQFNESGIKAEHLDGTMGKKEREAILNAFGKDFKVLTNCDILTTGYDCPELKTIGLFTATKSITRFYQMVGRGSRTTKKKSSFNILDFGSNILEFGRWEQEREFSLKKLDKKKSDKLDMEPYRICKKCSMFIRASLKECPFCGEEKVLTMYERLEVELKLLKPAELQGKLKEYTFEELEVVAKIKNYHKNWIPRVICARGGLQELKKFAQKKRYKSGWVIRTAINYGVLTHY